MANFPILPDETYVYNRRLHLSRLVVDLLNSMLYNKLYKSTNLQQIEASGVGAFVHVASSILPIDKTLLRRRAPR